MRSWLMLKDFPVPDEPTTRTFQFSVSLPHRFKLTISPESVFPKGTPSVSAMGSYKQGTAFAMTAVA